MTERALDLTILDHSPGNKARQWVTDQHDVWSASVSAGNVLCHQLWLHGLSSGHQCGTEADIVMWRQQWPETVCGCGCVVGHNLSCIVLLSSCLFVDLEH